MVQEILCQCSSLWNSLPNNTVYIYVKLYKPICYHAIVFIWFAYKQLNPSSYLFHAVYKDCLQTENQTCDRDS